MDVGLFDFELPPGLVAQEPAPRREEARLMVLPRRHGDPLHRRIADLPALLRSGDLLVVNDTRVVPARLRARRASGGRVELLVLPAPVAGAGPGERDVLLRASRRPRPGEVLTLPGGATARVMADHGDGGARLLFQGAEVARLLAEHGEMPLPPYIERAPDDPRSASDRERYQTVFARRDGAVAAPTAGLHLTPELLAGLAGAGIEVAMLTLHVGPGTFRPVTAERAEDHRLDAEWADVPDTVAAQVDRARGRGGRVLACGTTVVRALESRAGEDGRIRPGPGPCDLFILPGYRFRVVDGMLTNFHLPRSSLLMLVSALAGRERILQAYGEAVAGGYRFYSYGDAMLILPGEPA